jgi:beta-glucosidase
VTRTYEGIDLSGLPAGFVWGAATAAFQIEGDAEHRGDSIWDAYCRERGRILDGSDGRVACDHVARVADDVQLLRDLGVDAYRFSVAWPRVQPAGSGPLDTRGLAFYDRLVDLLLDAGVQPWATLYHWDLPLPLHEAGGWPGRDTAARFADYATAVHAALGDRVRNWMTLNEPWCSAWLGYGSGRHAPGITDHAQATRATHHLLLGHGHAVAAMRAQAPADHKFGIVLNLAGFVPAPSLPAQDAALVEAAVAPLDGTQNRLWLDALLEGRYPQDVLELLAPALPEAVQEGDLEQIATSLDFLGVNYYFDHQLAPTREPLPAGTGEYPGGEGLRAVAEGPDVTAMGWPVTPEGFRRMLVRIGREHPGAPPIVVTENGSAYAEGADPLDDPQRVDYLLRHVRALTDAVRDGADVHGYFAWSLMDNFEWAQGYTKRFGLARVDYDTLERRPRRSFDTYRALTAAQRGATP